MALADDLRLAFVFIPDGEVMPPDAFGPDTIRLPAVYYPQGLSANHGPARPPSIAAPAINAPETGFEQHHGA